MKTAMQEVIELVKKYDNREIPFNVMLFNLELLLEKEKEQIKESFEIGFNEGCSFMYDNGNDLKNGEQYYNQTYNQKQHIIDIMKADEDDGLYDLNK